MSYPIIIEADTPMELWKKVLWSFVLDCEGVDPDIMQSSTPSITRFWGHNYILRCKRPCVNDLDLATSGYKLPQRWTRFVKEYLHQEDFLAFTAQFTEVNAWQEAGVQPRVIADHNLGNCLMGTTVGGKGKGLHGRRQEPHVTLFSRASMFAPVGCLDIAYGSAVAQVLGRVRNIDPDDITMTWHISQILMIGWKMLIPMSILGLIPDNLNDLPDTIMGRAIAQEIREIEDGKLPKLKMLFRDDKLLRKVRHEGYRPDPYYAFIPSSYITPSLREGEPREVDFRELDDTFDFENTLEKE